MPVLSFDILARDRNAKTEIRGIGEAAKASALQVEAANLRVERSARALSVAQAKHGAASLEAREASLKLSKAQADLDRVVTRTAASTDRSSRSTGRWREAATVAGAAVGLMLFRFGKDSVKAYTEAQTSQAQLEDAYRRFPRLADVNIGAFRRLNSQMQTKVRFDDDALASGEAVLAQYKLTGSQIRELTPLLADYAARTGKDLPTAARDLGKALLGQGRALKGVGIQFVDTGSATGNYTELVGGLRRQVGGFAEREGKTAAGQAAILRNEFEELQEQAGQRLLPALLGLGRGLLALIGFVSRNQRVIVPLVATLGAFAAGVMAINAASRAVAASAHAWEILTGAIERVGGAGKGARAGLSSLGSFIAGPWGIALLAGAGALAYFAKKHAESKARVDELKESLDKQTGAITSNTRATVFNGLQQSGAIRDAKALGVSLKDLTDAALGNAGAMDRVRTQLDNVARANGNALLQTGAQKEATRSQGQAADRLRDAISGSNKEIRKAQAANKDAAAAGIVASASADGLADSTGDLAAEMKDERTEAQKLRDELDRLTGKNIAADEAAINYADTVHQLSETLKGNKRTWDLNTEAGRQNRTALIAAARAAADHMVAMRDEGRSENDVRRAASTHRAELIRLATQLGLNRRQTQLLIDRYLAVPKRIPTRAELDTAAALRAADILRRRILALPNKNVRISATTIYYGDGSARHINPNGTLGPIMRARGGPIWGAGTETSDSIPARLSRNEHVISAREVRGAGGHGAIESMRAMWRGATGFATGGAVAVAGAQASRVADAIGMALSRFTHIIVDRLVHRLGVGGGGPALGWARSQVGKPYIWGGVGPRGYDCSGFQSAIENVIQHRYPYARRFTTASFPAAGWAPGPGTYMIGRTRNAGGGIGHMAGTLGGVNVESRGSVGVVVGPRARGARNGLFGGQIWHLRGFARGGRAGDPPFDLLSPDGMEYLGDDVRDAALGRRGFDRGGLARRAGWWPKGPAPERVLDARQTRAFEDWMRVSPAAGGGRGVVIERLVLENHGVLGSQFETQRWLREGLVALRRDGRLRAALGLGV